MTHSGKLTFGLEVPLSQESKSPCKISTLFESYNDNITSINIQMIDIHSLEDYIIYYIMISLSFGNILVNMINIDQM